MSRKASGRVQGPSQGVSGGRRDLLKSALVVLGAGVLVQPNGGVSGSAFASDKNPADHATAKIHQASPLAKSGAKMDSKTTGKAGAIKNARKQGLTNAAQADKIKITTRTAQ